MNAKPPQPKERVVRVFVSSTFRDMNAEREELGKFIFPELRRFCRERDVEFVEVDLRWGVTEEQSQRGETLAVCLAEIEHCRPYFIGLLGERYGWVPGEFRGDVIESNRWLAALSDRSVTELEILHGVLNNPAMSDRAAFYFRDPYYLEQIPAQLRPAFTSESAQAAQKLAALKGRIRQSGLPVLEDYPDPQTVARQIGADLRRAIELEFPPIEARDWLAKEASGHEIYAHSHARVYIGRELDLARVDSFVASTPAQSQPPSPTAKPAVLGGLFKKLMGQPDAPTGPRRLPEVQSPPEPGGVLVILGPSGGGKTALLANWALRWQAAHPGDYLFLHFFGSTPGSADYAGLLLRLLQALKARFNIAQPLPDTPEALQDALPNWLAMAAAHGPRLVLVLDGLNQLEDRDQALDLGWLPQQLPVNVRVLVSTLPGRSLEALRQRPHSELEVQPLSPEERLRLVDAYLGRYKKRLEERRAKRIVANAATANPLYLRVFLEELRQLGSFEQLDTRIDHYLQARTSADLYEKVLERLEGDYDRERPGLVKETLSLVWAARRGLGESELLELLGSVPRAVWSPLYLALEEALVNRGGVLNFFHDYLRQAVHDRYLPQAAIQHEIRLRLAAHFEQRGLDGRQVDELPWLLAQVKDWRRLYERLADLHFFTAAWANNPFEVRNYWAQVEANSTLRKIQAYQDVLQAPQAHDDGLWALARLLYLTGNPQEALALDAHLAERYRQTGDQRNLARCLGNQAAVLADRGDPHQALALYQEQEQLARKLGDQEALRSCLGNQATILKTLGNLDAALALLQNQERLARQAGDLDSLQQCLGNQALLLYARGDFAGATALLQEQERIARRMGNQDGVMASLNNQAAIAKDMGELDRAMTLYEAAAQISRDLGRLDGLQSILGGQALILQTRGDWDGALTLLAEGERICRNLGNLDALQTCLGNRGTILFQLGRLDEAMALQQEKERICRQLDKPDSLQRALGDQALIHMHRKSDDRALTLLKEQERIARTLGNLDSLQRCLGNQANILAGRGDLDEALALEKEKERICRQLGNRSSLAKTLGNQASIHYRRGNLAGAMALYKEEESIARKLGSLDDLQRSLGNQALILWAQTDLAGAMMLLKEQERITRQLGSPAWLARALKNQAMILFTQGQRGEARQIAQQALQLAQQSGDQRLAQEIEGISKKMGA